MTAPAAPRVALPNAYADDARSFIETQFPVSKLNKESYKERKANHGQTLTGLGKWWGREPLVLVRELGVRRCERTPRVGDAFCGGGSIPFEAARIGCEAYGSDLNPVAALFTWAALNVGGGGEAVAREAAAHDDAEQGRAWLRAEVPGYWGERARLVAVLRYLADRGRDLPGWRDADARAAGLVAGAVENDSV